MPPLRATRAFPIAFALGAIAACGFAPLQLWPLTLLCFAALGGLLDETASLRRAVALGWWFGLGHFCLGLNWIATAFTYQAAMPAWLGWVAVMLLSLYLAVFPAFATGVAWVLAGRRRLALPAMLGAGWILGELLRATLFTGFAWNPVAAIWVPVEPMRVLTIGIGTYGLSGLTVALGALLWEAATRPIARLVLVAFVLAETILAFLQPRHAPPRPDAPWLHVVQPTTVLGFSKYTRMTSRSSPARLEATGSRRSAYSIAASGS